MSHSVFILYISFLLWAGYCLGIGLFFFSLTLVSFYFWFVDQLVLLPHSYIASAMVSLNLCLLGLLWACHVLFFLLVYITQYFCLVSFHIILGFLGPFYSFGHPWPISFLHSHGFLLNLSGFFGSITISFTFGVCWPLH